MSALQPFLLAVMGATASGKTDLAERLAREFDAQLLNADAFQIYTGMDIGTAKPVNKEQYRFLDIRKPSEGFGVGEFVSLAQQELEQLWREQRNVIVVGGTGLYIRALFEEYDAMGQAPPPGIREELDSHSLDELVAELVKVAPGVAEKVDKKNRVRVQRSLERIRSPKPSVPVRLPPFRKHKFAVTRDLDETSERISMRTQEMFRSGWVQEVEKLARQGYSEADPGFRAIGYGAILRCLNGESDLQTAQATTIAETRQYAKRQRTWLRSEPNLIYLDSENELEDARRILSQFV